MVNDAIITDPNDELFDLQQKYGIRISRSNKSDAVYIFKKVSHKIRIGHPINRNQEHLRNFENVPVKEKVTKDVVEKVIKMYLNKL